VLFINFNLLPEFTTAITPSSSEILIVPFTEIIKSLLASLKSTRMPSDSLILISLLRVNRLLDEQPINKIRINKKERFLE
jgi:hypothetical protein